MEQEKEEKHSHFCSKKKNNNKDYIKQKKRDLINF